MLNDCLEIGVNLLGLSEGITDPDGPTSRILRNLAGDQEQTVDQHRVTVPRRQWAFRRKPCRPKKCAHENLLVVRSARAAAEPPNGGANLETMATSQVRDGLPLGLRICALVATSIGTFTSMLDTSIANVALPTIAREFHVAPEVSIWVVTAFQLAVTATLLMFATLGDRVGPARLYLGALLVFVLASIGCALSTSFPMLVTMRAIQGIAGSANMVMTAPINRTLYPRRMLGYAIANNALFVALGAASGPTIGGLILTVAPWQWLFWVNVPICTIGLLFGLRFLPKPAGVGGPFDLPSAALAAIGFSTFVYGFDGLAHGATSASTVGIAAGGIVVLAMFIVRQTRIAHPLMAVDLFRLRLFAFSAAASFATYTAQGAIFVTLPFFLQSVLAQTPFQAGLYLAAWPIGTLIAARIVARLTDRYPAAILGTIGTVVMGSGLVALGFLPHATWVIATIFAVAGAGFGFFQTPNNHTMVSATPPERTGRATGIVATTRLSGQTVGAASVAIIFGTLGHDLELAIASALWFSAMMCFIAAILSRLRAGTSSSGSARI